MHFIRPESLRASTLFHWSLKAHPETQKAGLCDHNAVVDAEPFVSSEHPSASLLGHNGHHLLEPYITADAANNQNFFTSDVSHCTFRYFHKHGEDGLLQRETQVC